MMMKENLNKTKCRLVEKLGIHFENRDKLAPVEARILSYIILTGKQGTTFEDLVSNLSASKSTVSTHITHLQDLKKVEYFTKTGDRKKYFVINNDTMLQSITELMDQWAEQKQLHVEIMDFKINANESLDEDTQFNLEFHEGYIDFLDEATQSISKLRTKIIEKNTKL
jgi:DNA-binding transcriptional regulator GbsR (MarR family)